MESYDRQDELSSDAEYRSTPEVLGALGGLIWFVPALKEGILTVALGI